MTVTLNEQALTFPAASVAVQVTDVIPTGKAVPGGMLYETLTPGQLSLAVAAKFTTAEQLPGSL